MSFLRRLSVGNPFQNWSPHLQHPNKNDLHPQIKDDTFRLHLSSSSSPLPHGDFTRIDEQSLLTARIVATNSQARKLLQACHKLDIVDRATGCPRTENVNRGMGKAMSMLSLGKQRELVMFLFFWEEEIMRWNLLEVEERDVSGQLFDHRLSEGWRDELRQSLMVVQGKKRLLPSARDGSGRGLTTQFDGGGDVEEMGLPSYEDVRRMRSSV